MATILKLSADVAVLIIAGKAKVEMEVKERMKAGREGAGRREGMGGGRAGEKETEGEGKEGGSERG